MVRRVLLLVLLLLVLLLLVLLLPCHSLLLLLLLQHAPAYYSLSPANKVECNMLPLRLENMHPETALAWTAAWERIDADPNAAKCSLLNYRETEMIPLRYERLTANTSWLMCLLHVIHLGSCAFSM
jgi:hypothetical protein